MCRMKAQKKNETKEQIKVSLEWSHAHKWNNQISRLTEAVWGSLPLISLRWSVWFVDKISLSQFNAAHSPFGFPDTKTTGMEENK